MKHNEIGLCPFRPYNSQCMIRKSSLDAAGGSHRCKKVDTASAKTKKEADATVYLHYYQKWMVCPRLI